MNNLAEKLERWPTATMPVKVFCELYLVKNGTVYSWISRKNWKEGHEFCRDPLGHVHIIIEGYEKWVRSKAAANTPPASGRTATASKSNSSRPAKKVTAMKRSRGTPPQLT